MLTFLAFALGQAAEETAFVEAALPIAERALVERGPGWRLYTAPGDPNVVRTALERALARRKGWRLVPSGWLYESGLSGKIISFESVRVDVLQGRAMPWREAVSQKDLWTTVRIVSNDGTIRDRGRVLERWTLATRPEDDAAAGVPVGEERRLADLVGLPLVAHEATFGIPWWCYTGPVSMGETSVRLARVLTGRPGWSGSAATPVVGKSGLYPTRWDYTPPKGTEGRPLELRVCNGEAVPRGAPSTHSGGWSTVQVFAKTPNLGARIVRMWNPRI